MIFRQDLQAIMYYYIKRSKSFRELRKTFKSFFFFGKYVFAFLTFTTIRHRLLNALKHSLHLHTSSYRINVSIESMLLNICTRYMHYAVYVIVKLY